MDTRQLERLRFQPIERDLRRIEGLKSPKAFFGLLADFHERGIGGVFGAEVSPDPKNSSIYAFSLRQGGLSLPDRDYYLRADFAKERDAYRAHVTKMLTLGENIADLGGITIAYEALQRALARDPARRRTIDGFTPEQRFFLSLAQLWRTNTREEEARRLVTTDTHSPGQFRAIGPHVNVQEFHDAFAIKPGTPMYRTPELRARIW